MFSSIVHEFKYGKHTIVLDTGTIARQANASVMVSMDDTTILVTIVNSQHVKLEQDFFPLVVNYQERDYAAGKFPGGFFRREGRPNEHEILAARLIDRSIRPLFSKGYYNDVQVVVTVLSVDPQIHPDIVAIIGASAALSLSDIPFIEPIGSARIGYINKQYVLNPTVEELAVSQLDLVVSGTERDILMVESQACLLSEEEILGAIIFGHEQQQIIIHNIKKLVMRAGKNKCLYKALDIDIDIKEYISKVYIPRIREVYLIRNKQTRIIEIDCLKKDVLNTVIHRYNLDLDNNGRIVNFLNDLGGQIIRDRIIREHIRCDGRSENMVRALDIKVGILSRTHGSALFTRGNTQALVTVTLGTERDAQNIDRLMGDYIDRFLLHYNFPAYCVGEVGIISAPKRREIGHGKLAKRSILAVIPTPDEFPYTIRVVSEITESDGSSSMASVCGASLALMDAGVPIKTSISGVAMGLIKEGDDFVVLSDIVSDEDHIGDMDLKVAGSRQGVTALQMDIKISGVSHEIIAKALYQSHNARLQILDMMDQVINISRQDISKFAPRIYNIKINPDKIKNVIGKGGSVIRALTEETDTVIDISNDGTVKIVSSDSEKAKYAIHRIQEITTNIKIGAVYNGKVTQIVEFGAFVSIFSGKEGLIHISQISEKRVKRVTDYLKIGQDVLVRVLEIDRQGRMRLSMKAVHE